MAQSVLSTKKQQQQLLILGVIVAIAVIAVLAVVFLSGQTPTTTVNFEEIPQSRTADGGFVMGDPNAPITIVEFADFGCPHCIDYKETMHRFVNEYVKTGRAKFEFRIFPTAGGAVTHFAGRVAECANQQRQGAYWEAYEAFFNMAASGRFDENVGRKVAEQLNLDYGQILTCTNDAEQVDADIALGQRVGISGTPAVMVRVGDSEPTWITVGGQTYNRAAVPYEVLQQVVESYQ